MSTAMHLLLAGKPVDEQAMPADGREPAPVSWGLELLASALVGLLVAAGILGVSRAGLNLTDETINFRFGGLVLDGLVPYRDFNYQVGPFPVLWDALFQSVFGRVYLSSLIAGAVIKSISGVALYACFRQVLGRSEAVMLGAALMLLTPIAAHKSYADAAMFCLIFAACALWAWRLRSMSLAMLAGMALACVAATRQSNGMMCVAAIATTLAWASVVRFHVDHWRMTGGVLIGLWVGLAGWASYLWMVDALEPAWVQVFAEAGEKKPYTSLEMIVDALTGGTAVTGRMSLLVGNVGPLVVAALAGLLFWFKQRRWAVVLLGLFAVVGTCMDAWGLSRGPIGVWIGADVPRVMLTLLAIIMAFWQKLSLGIWLVIAIALGEIWGMQISWMGRDHLSQTMMPLFVVVLMLCPWWSMRWRHAVALLIVAASVTGYASTALTRADAKSWDQYTNADNSKLRAIYLPREKAELLTQLQSHVQPGDRMFIYGGAAVLYTLLDAENPTAVQMIYPDYISMRDAQAMAHVLTNDPPTWLIATWGPSFIKPYADANPMDLPSDTPPEHFGFNGVAMSHLHQAIHGLMSRYECVVDAANIETPTPHGLDSDRSTVLRLYRLRAND